MEKLILSLANEIARTTASSKDTRRHRFARKFLPDEISKDAQARARFQGEAQAASALNQPSINVKPANLFVTERGQAKIVDFGLAKITPTVSSLNQTASGDTLTAVDEQHLTSPGSTLGTVAHMSPVQVRAKELDPRSNLFVTRSRALRDGDGHAALPRRKPQSHLRSHFRRATHLRLQGCESHSACPFPSGARPGKAALFRALLIGFFPGG
jgi:serine/threonine protein kinase